jgi:hypothetical protein
VCIVYRQFNRTDFSMERSLRARADHPPDR